jgi:hypothetical protein
VDIEEIEVEHASLPVVSQRKRPSKFLAGRLCVGDNEGGIVLYVRLVFSCDLKIDSFLLLGKSSI